MEQLLIVIKLALSTLPSRRGPALVVVIGMACAIGALVSIKSMDEGLFGVINMGRADRAIVLAKNTQYESASTVSHADSATIADAPGIARTSDGHPLASPQALAYAVVRKKSDGFSTSVVLRGVGPQGLAVLPDVKLISGRMFRPGKFEVIVGRSAARMFQGLELGRQVPLPGGGWTVTGIFTSDGDSHESEILTDADTLIASQHTSDYKSVEVLLSSPATFRSFRDALTADPRLSVDVKNEREYLAENWKTLTTMLSTVAWLVGGIMGFGALLGAFNTMFNAVQVRTVEIATLRALGYSGGTVLASVLVEAVVLSAAGALLGMALAFIAFNGAAHSMGSGLVIRLAVTPRLILTGLSYACLLGFLGGLWPAMRALRLPVAAALHTT